MPVIQLKWRCGSIPLRNNGN
uniref:Uncharacterized protein n=1 Tax=Anguilla anguilla TaxID=7936 RepID=A0A0E9TLG7_ANGAN